ncbi:MAG TPA: hypothetical protein VFA12_20325 [Stellaceae bacterium]|nr:hypothetical protein [Stellaceae bacterium]
MDNSATVGAVMFAIMQTMRRVDWRVIPAADTPEAEEAAEFVHGLMDDMSHTWPGFVVEALSMLGYGYAINEVVYKRRLGRKPKDGADASSKYNDGKIGWRRLPIRSQDTILKWFFDANGQIKGVTQQPWVGRLIDLPIEKFLLFRPSSHKNNPEGRSILRTAYRSYYLVKRMEEMEAILMERFAGLPVVKVPSALLEAAATGDATATAQVAAYKKLVTNIRVDEQMGVMMPSDTYEGADGPSNVPRYTLELLTPQGTQSGVRSHEIVTRHSLNILKTVLADFIDLGHQARGTQNLAISKVDMFYAGIEGWLDSMAAVLNQHGLPRLWELNRFDPDLLPQISPDMPDRIDIDAIGNFVLNLSRAGVHLFDDPETRQYLRGAAGLPEVSEEEDELGAERDAADREGEARRGDGNGASGLTDDDDPADDSPARNTAKALVRMALREAQRKRKGRKPIASVTVT